MTVDFRAKEKKMRVKCERVLALLCFLALSGCASMTAHNTKVGTSMQSAGAGDLNAALKQLDEGMSAESDRKGLLYNLEKGDLLRLIRRYDESLERFGVADAIVKEWEDTATKNPEKLLGTIGAALISERLKSYEGQDYEKVMLTVRMAQARLAKGDFEQARVDIKRTHEREAIIEEFRAKETVSATEEAKARGVTSTSKELSGYPTETLNDPEVLALKNGYANAFGHYLSGYLYEALNESDLAAPGYRKAIELRPDVPVLENGLKGLDSRSAAYGRRRNTDVLFVVESGFAPARESRRYTIPVPTGRGMVAATLAYPVIKPGDRSSRLGSLSVGGKSLDLEGVTDFNVMARRALKDEMPGMMVRAAIRAIVKGVAQDQASKNFGAYGGLASLVVAVASVATEGADDRIWRALPERIEVSRTDLPPGTYSDVRVGSIALPEPIEVSGGFMVVPIRVIGSRAYVGEISRIGQTREVLPPPPVVVQVVEVVEVEQSGVKEIVMDQGKKTPPKPTGKKAQTREAGTKATEKSANDDSAKQPTKKVQTKEAGKKAPEKSAKDDLAKQPSKKDPGQNAPAEPLK